LHPTAKTKHKVQCRFFLDVVVWEKKKRKRRSIKKEIRTFD
jgi:hypothetical protein